MRLLVVEDDRTLSDGICLALGGEAYSFTQCFDLRTSLEALEREVFDLILLDNNLPDGTGYDLLRRLRPGNAVPVLMLTANDLEMHEVMGFQLGADDYMTKPFSLAVLRARIENLLRRKRGAESYTCGTLSFSFDRMEFRKGGEELTLSRTEQKLLRLLVENRGMTLRREALVDRLWTDGAEYVDENALSVTVRRLREKIEDDPSRPVHIQTVYGLGYVWKEGE